MGMGISGCIQRTEKLINETKTVERITPANRLVYFSPLKNNYEYYFKDGFQGWNKLSSTSEPYIGKLIYPQNLPEPDLGGLTGNQVLVIKNKRTLSKMQVGLDISDILQNNSKLRWETWFVYKNYTPSRDYGCKGKSQSEGDEARYEGCIWVDKISKNDWAFEQIKSIGNITFTIKTNKRIYAIDWLNYDTDFRRKWTFLNNVNKYQELENPIQELCFNAAYKYDWVYARLDIDLIKNEYLEFQCMERIWNLKGLSPYLTEETKDQLVSYGIESSVYNADSDTYLYIDSTCISGE